MKIKLSEVLSVPDKVEVVNGHIDMKDVCFQDNTYTLSNVEEFPVTITNIGKKKVSVKFNTEFTINLSCSRCLKDLPEVFSIDIDEVVDMEEVDKEDQDLIEEVPYVDHGELDVDRLIIDELFPMLPIQTLCSDDCKGLCKVCGCNMNEVDCGCDQHVMDPRMAVFGDVFSQFNLDN